MEMIKLQMQINGVEANPNFKQAKEHPIIKQLMDEKGAQSKEIKAALKMIEKLQTQFTEVEQKNAKKAADQIQEITDLQANLRTADFTNMN